MSIKLVQVNQLIVFSYVSRILQYYRFTENTKVKYKNRNIDLGFKSEYKA